jgi:formylglycine-generating enzyme required for sulfatase activity
VLGEFDERKLPTADQAKLKEMLLELYATDPDAGIHAASEWVLRRWNADVQLKELTHALATGQPDGKRKWYVNKQGQTLAIIAGPTEFLMGSPSSEEGRSPHIETQRHERIDRSFAIMTHEVTIDQFSKAMGIEEQCNDAQGIQLFRAISNDDAAVSNMSWYLAAAYCNWLSKQEGIPEDEWCYLPNDDMRYSEGMKYASGYLDRRGYRLPTTKEWEYACRAGAFTARYFGETEELLGEYAWYAKNSPSGQESEVGHLKPNDMGLFDMLGNMREWCSDASVTVPIDKYFRQAGYPGQFRIMRGGSFNDHPTGLRSAAEDPVIPASYVTHGFGMRAARTHP